MLSVVAVLAVGLVSCSDETPGDPRAGDQTTNEPSTEPTEPTRGSSSRPTSGNGPLADIKPCSLLSADGKTQLGISGGEERKVGRARSCRWRLEGATGTDSFTLDVAIYDELGIKDVVGSEIKPVPTLGSHEAVQYVPPAAGCAVGVAVSDSSRVDTQAVGGAQQKACELALQLATFVEPELP
jgi:hypothetical protein